ncbi:siderophore ABC transporter substrate-binding protein [Corticicoccus populi]|uniref:Siderophore ABC transporter substrate-binding protein n=1 Tax=Corticicoccus populi TaxID=1812821 RepID=A0ABW5WWN5_9STAP
MTKYKFLQLTVLMAVFALVLAACSNSGDEAETDDSNNETSEETTDDSNAEEGSDESADAGTVEIEDAHGTVEVPVNPESVVALDNRTFETLDDWGVELTAAAVSLMPSGLSYLDNDSIEDIGNHREPNLEAIAAANPDLVIVGQRFSGYYEDIKELVPEAAVIDLNVNVDETAETPGENLVNGLKDNTTKLGQIFEKEAEAEQLNADFDQAVEDATAAYNGSDTVMSVIVSGGEIGFSAPHNGRVWGPMYEIFGWEPSLEVEGSTEDHQGDDISVEAIADSNPDWIMVLDRDADMDEESTPAQDVIENSPALQNTTAVSEGQVIYAPADTYLNESIQTYIELFGDISNTLNQ